jgi:SulP family sulfate permease
MVLAVINALLSVALMSLIFRGDLEDDLPLGIGLGLVASAVVGIVVALGSSFPGMYAGIQDASAAILAVSAASIATRLVGPAAIDTVLAMIAATSLATGLVFLLMGYFNLGDIARFVPFPVISRGRVSCSPPFSS